MRTTLLFATLLIGLPALAAPADFERDVATAAHALAGRTTVAPPLVFERGIGSDGVDLKGEATFVFPTARVHEVLDAYISSHPNEYLTGGHLEGKPIYYRRDPRGPGGASRLLPRYQFDKRVPITADVQQTVIDHGNGTGEIHIEPRSGPLAGSRIRLRLKEYARDGASGTRVDWNLDELRLTPLLRGALRLSTAPLTIAEETFGRLPFVGAPFRIPSAVARGVRGAALSAVSGMIIHTASNGPRSLARIIDLSRAGARTRAGAAQPR